MRHETWKPEKSRNGSRTMRVFWSVPPPCTVLSRRCCTSTAHAIRSPSDVVGTRLTRPYCANLVCTVITQLSEHFVNSSDTPSNRPRIHSRLTGLSTDKAKSKDAGFRTSPETSATFTYAAKGGPAEQNLWRKTWLRTRRGPLKKNMLNSSQTEVITARSRISMQVVIRS